MKKLTSCYQPMLLQVSDDDLFYWCFLVKDPKKNPKNYEIRLSSIISDIDDVLIEFKKQTPNLKIVKNFQF